MDHAAPLPFLRETLLFLTLVGILIPLLQRFRINQVLGFLAVGVLVGPHGIGLWVDQWPWLENLTFARLGGAQSLADLGVIFLMFLIGLELSAQRLWSMRRWVFAGGSAQVLLSALAIGLIAWAFGNTPMVAIVLGLVLSLSSTAVVLQLLAQQRSLAQPLGQAVFAILMLQDLAVVPLLILIDILGRDTSSGLATLLSVTLLKSAAVVTLIFVVGRRVIEPVFRMFARQHQPEVFMALTLLVALSTAGATAAAGLSMALGAFMAGLLLAETQYRHEVEVTIEPFKGLLMGLFFMSVGMGIDGREVMHQPGWILVSVAGLVAIKTLVTGAVLRVGGMSWGRSLEGGLLLAQGGEFAFIVVGAAAALALLQPALAQFMLLVVSLSLLVTPLAARAGRVLGERIDRHQGRPADDQDTRLPDGLAGHIVIAGQGRVGPAAGGRLSRAVRSRMWRSSTTPSWSRGWRAKATRCTSATPRVPDLLRKLHTARRGRAGRHDGPAGSRDAYRACGARRPTRICRSSRARATRCMRRSCARPGPPPWCLKPWRPGCSCRRLRCM
jgi:CPA2 family monovalent cation:H+ antiporter-2